MTESEASRTGAVASAASTFLPRKLRVSLLSNVYLLAGRYGEALARAEQALELAHRYHEKGSAAWALYMDPSKFIRRHCKRQKRSACARFRLIAISAWDVTWRLALPAEHANI
jgi:hypothetical protein